MTTPEITVASRQLESLVAEAANLKATIVNLERSRSVLMNGSRLPQEFAIKVTDAVNKLRERRALGSSLEAQRDKLREELKRTQAAKASEQEAAQNGITVTRQDDKDARHYITPMEHTSILHALSVTLKQRLEERVALDKQCERNHSAVSELTIKLDDLSDMDWELFRVEAENRIKEEQLRSVNDEITSIQRIFAHKTALRDRLLSFDATRDVAPLAHVKTIEFRRLTQHFDQSRERTSAIRLGAVTTKAKEEKINLLGGAIRDLLGASETSDDDAQFVDAEIVDELRIQSEEVRRQEERVQAALEYFDAQVRTLEARVEILDHAKDVRRKGLENVKAMTDRRIVMIESQGAEKAASAKMLVVERQTRNAKVRTLIAAPRK